MIEQWSAVSSKEKIEYTVRLKQSEQNTQHTALLSKEKQVSNRKVNQLIRTHTHTTVKTN